MVAVRLIGNKARAALEFFEKIDIAESDNILTKLQDLLVYLIPQLNKFEDCMCERNLNAMRKSWGLTSEPTPSGWAGRLRWAAHAGFLL